VLPERLLLQAGGPVMRLQASIKGCLASKRGQAFLLCVAPDNKGVHIVDRFECKLRPMYTTRGVVMWGRLRRSGGWQFTGAVVIFALAVQSTIASVS
jgi:hypothetical protein